MTSGCAVRKASAFSATRHSTGPTALTVAVGGEPSNMPISPNIAPGSRTRVIDWPPFETSTCPRIKKYIRFVASPSCSKTSPAAKFCIGRLSSEVGMEFIEVILGIDARILRSLGSRVESAAASERAQRYADEL